MMQQAVPVANTIEDATFSLVALASRDGPIIETKDWTMGDLPQFSDTRKTGWPILDIAILAPGNANVIVRVSFDAATFLDWQVMAAVGGSPGVFSLRIPAHFARVRVTDTSNAANNGIRLWQRIGSQ